MFRSVGVLLLSCTVFACDGDRQKPEMFIDDLPEFGGSESTGMTGVWEDCDQEVDMESGNTWQLRYNRHCVRLCSEDGSVEALSDYPLWGYDNNENSYCVYDAARLPTSTSTGQGDLQVSAYVHVPVYVANESPVEKVFENESGNLLTYGDGTWRCNSESRTGIGEIFQSSAEDWFYRFKPDGDLKHWSSEDSTEKDSVWSFENIGPGHTWAIRLGSYYPELLMYHGYLELQKNKLAIYQTAFDRKVCERVSPVQVFDFPESVDQIRSLPVISAATIEGKPLQCTPFESYGGGYYTRTPFNGLTPAAGDLSTFIVNVTVVETDSTGNRQHQIVQASSDATDRWAQHDYYTAMDDGAFTAPRHSGFNGDHHEAIFRQGDGYVLLEDTELFFDGYSGNVRVITHSKCVE